MAMKKTKAEKALAARLARALEDGTAEVKVLDSLAAFSFWYQHRDASRPLFMVRLPGPKASKTRAVPLRPLFPLLVAAVLGLAGCYESSTREPEPSFCEPYCVLCAGCMADTCPYATAQGCVADCRRAGVEERLGDACLPLWVNLTECLASLPCGESLTYLEGDEANPCRSHGQALLDSGCGVGMP